jgi:histidinol-phosphate aminotransferase
MAGKHMSRFWSDVVNTLTPYVPGEQPHAEKLVKLNTNESPYPPSPQVLQAINSVSADALRLYPDPESVALRQAIAARNGIQPEQVFVGNGSDEVIALVFMALLKHSLPLYFPDISYSFYPDFIVITA